MDADAKISDVLQLAIKAHGNQRRKESGLPYVFHVVSVANKLSKCGIFDEVVIAAALLHDILEDTTLLRCDLEGPLDILFGEEKSDKILSIVEELTRYGETPESKLIYLNSFATKSVESLVIKILDRIDNVEDYAATNAVYAEKYRLKAKPIFAAFINKYMDVVDRFGIRSAGLVKFYITSWE